MNPFNFDQRRDVQNITKYFEIKARYQQVKHCKYVCFKYT